jgi:hypothetical protein
VYEVAHVAPTSETCPRCAEPALERVAVERAEHFVFAPVWPLSWRAYTRCTACKEKHDVELPVAPPKRVLSRRIVIGWLIVAAAIVLIAIHLLAAADELDERASRPAIGDEWTVQVWRFDGFDDHNAAAWGRVRVIGLDDAEIRIAGCTAIGTAPDAVKPRVCDRFPVDLAPIKRSDVLRRVADGSINGISRPSGGPGWWFFAITLCAIAWVANGIAAAAFTRGFDMPSARVVTSSRRS